MLSFNFYINYLMLFWLCRVFAALGWLPLVVLSWVLLCIVTATLSELELHYLVVAPGLQSKALGSCGMCTEFLLGTWILLQPEVEPTVVIQ